MIPGSGRSPGEGIGYPLQYSWVSLIAQLVKNLPAMQETGFNLWIGKIPCRRCFNTSSDGEEKKKKHIKRGAKGGLVLSPARVRSLSLPPHSPPYALLLSHSLFSSRLLGWYALMPRGSIFLYFLNKTEL